MKTLSEKRIAVNIFIVAAAVVGILLLWQQASTAAPSDNKKNDVAVAEADYQSRLFDNSYVHTIDIQMDTADFTELLENASEKNKYPASVTVDGENFAEIAVSAKGSASLRSVMKDPENNRYSLKLTFNRYDEDQTYYGLESIHLNNNVSDASYMRDCISYSMFNKMGYPAPLCSYAVVTVNGEDYGFFTVVENIGEGFLNRTLNKDGELYKPDRASKVRGANLGADLTYNGNLPWSYSDIFDNAVTECSDKDKKAVIQALKNLSEGNVEDGVFTDMVCRYFAIHNFTLNSDSYLQTSSTVHNYILYEYEGRLALLPWDYNNAYALSDNIQMEFLIKNMSEEAKNKLSEVLSAKETLSASYYINKGIDTPLMGKSDSRPMWSFIPENQTYLEQYHACMEEFISEYFESGFFEKEFNRVYKMISPYVKADVSKIYTVEEFEAAAEKLKTICTLRAQSIRKQLNGELSCDSTLQNEADWIDASVLDN